MDDEDAAERGLASSSSLKQPKTVSKRSRKKAKKNRENKAEKENHQVIIDHHPTNKREKVLGVFVHYSDCLNLDVQLLHPSVRVLLVNLETGGYVAKQKRENKVTCYEEGNVGHILPLMTQPFVFRVSRTLVPRWEELLIFNESFHYLAHPSEAGADDDGGKDGDTMNQTRMATTRRHVRESLGLFFLVQDFVSMTRANNSNAAGGRKRSGEGRGWRDVAWAFLKPFPSPDEANTERRLRLQLFKPGTRKEGERSEAKVVWDWWKNRKHVKYPSSLYVTVQAIDPPTPGSNVPSDPNVLTTDTQVTTGSGKKTLLNGLQRETPSAVSFSCVLLQNHYSKIFSWKHKRGTIRGIHLPSCPESFSKAQPFFRLQRPQRERRRPRRRAKMR